MAQEVIEQECCPETPAINPKAEIARARRHSGLRGVQIFNIENPILEEIEDPDWLSGIIDRWNLVPYAGTNKYSGHMQLYWYLMVAKLSPTHGACINKIVKYAFGPRATFERAVDPEYDLGEDEEALSKERKTDFREALKEFFDFEGGISKLHRRLGYGYKATGNGWIEMTYAETMGVPKVHLRVHKVAHCMYVRTETDQARRVAISPVWREDYLEKYPPRIVPLYPQYSRDAGGVVRTIFHLKNGDNEWYGRPDTESSDLYKYREIQDAMYLIKQAAGNFTGQVIIEAEDGDSQYDDALDDDEAKANGYSSFADEFEQNWTMKGDEPQMVMVTRRPAGAKPMFVFQFRPNTNENWYKETGTIAEDKITQSHNLTAQFMGRDTGTGLATDIIIGDYVFRNKPAIDDFRNEITVFTNSILSAAFNDLLGKDEFQDCSITFMSPIQKTIEDYKTQAQDALNTQNQNAAANQSNGNQAKPVTEPNNPGNPDKTKGK